MQDFNPLFIVNPINIRHDQYLLYCQNKLTFIKKFFKAKLKSFTSHFLKIKKKYILKFGYKNPISFPVTGLSKFLTKTGYFETLKSIVANYNASLKLGIVLPNIQAVLFWMLNLVHKIRKNDEDTKYIDFSVNPASIDREFIQTFGSKLNNSKPKDELDKLEELAVTKPQRLKKEKNLTGYDFRSLNKLKRGYLSLAKLVAISVYQYKLNLSVSLSKSSSVSSLSSICEEAPTLTESTSQTFIKSRKSFLPEGKFEEIHGKIFGTSTPKQENETTIYSGRLFEKNEENFEKSSEGSTSVQSILARDTLPVMVNTGQVNLTDVLKF